MISHITARLYSYDFWNFILRASVAAAIAIIIYSTIFGITW
jgi:hypothetical protein